MNPSYTKVNHCRVCGSENITDLEIDKNFYLMNLDQTVSAFLCSMYGLSIYFSW